MLLLLFNSLAFPHKIKPVPFPPGPPLPPPPPTSSLANRLSFLKSFPETCQPQENPLGPAKSTLCLKHLQCRQTSPPPFVGVGGTASALKSGNALGLPPQAIALPCGGRQCRRPCIIGPRRTPFQDHSKFTWVLEANPSGTEGFLKHFGGPLNPPKCAS